MSKDAMSPDRVRRGGLLGLGIGAGLGALSVFYLVVGFEEPQEVLGVFLPLAVALVCLGLGVMALVPLVLGPDDPRTGPTVARWFRVLAVAGLGLTGAGVLRGELPWTASGLLPVLVVGALVNESRRFSRLGTPRP